MRSRRRDGDRPTKASVKRLARKCGCGKLGYDSEHVAMDAVISGRYARAGVRVYQCDDSGLWHTTSERRVPDHAKGLPATFTPTDGPVHGELSSGERTLIHAVRFVRKLRRAGVRGDELLQASNAAQGALSAACRE